jgi:hypothetical protein
MDPQTPLRVTVSLGPPIPLHSSGEGGRPALATTSVANENPRLTHPSDAADGFSVVSLESTSFAWPTALSLALASRLVYSPKERVLRTAIEHWKLAHCQFIDVDDTQCFVAASAKAVVVSFRGTESTGDWLANLNLVSTTRSYGSVHRGFLGAFQVVEWALRGALARHANLPLLITGHSLGGAIATIAAAEWHGQYGVSAVYTFGQPAVGRSEFCKWFEHKYAGRFTRFVNDDDIVPMVPPGYQHAGHLIHFRESGRPRGATESIVAGEVAPLEAADSRMLSEAEFDSLRVQLLSRRSVVASGGAAPGEAASLEGLFPSIKDHAIDEYIRKILANVHN